MSQDNFTPLNSSRGVQPNNKRKMLVKKIAIISGLIPLIALTIIGLYSVRTSQTITTPAQTQPEPSSALEESGEVCSTLDPVSSIDISCSTGTCSWDPVEGTDYYKVSVIDTTIDDTVTEYDPFKLVGTTEIKFDSLAGHSYKCTVETVHICAETQTSSQITESSVCDTETLADESLSGTEEASEKSVASEGEIEEAGEDTNIEPTPSDIIVANNVPAAFGGGETSPTPAPTTASSTSEKGGSTATPTVKPTNLPTASPKPTKAVASSTPIPSLPIAGNVSISIIALAGVLAIVFGFIAFR